MEFCYSWAIAVTFHYNFTYVSETYDFIELIMIYEDLFLVLLILVSSQPYLNLKYT